MGKKIRIRDVQPGSYFGVLRNNSWVKMLTFLDADPGRKKSGSRIAVRMVQTQITFRILEIWVKKVSKFTFYKQNIEARARGLNIFSSSLTFCDFSV
jgi:hypothetical protein